MPWINCLVNLILTWSADCVLSDTNVNQATKFSITDTKLYVMVVTLSTQDNAKLLKSGFKKTMYCNKYQSKVSVERQNQYFDFLIDPSFQWVKRLFVLSFLESMVRTGHTGCFLSNVEIKDHNVMINGQPFLINQ